MSATAAAGPALAQTAPGGGAGKLEEIIVTAQKREENLQQVPVAVSAFTAESLQAQRITNVHGLDAIVPNMAVLRQPSNAALPSFSIRGILAGDTAAQVDNGVSTYIDGVYIGRQAGTLFDVADLERIEVLRGPQGTLFGRNTTGGAISLITRHPKGELGLTQDLTYGNYDNFRSKTRLDLPAFGPVKAAVTYMHSQIDGFVKNLAAGTVRDYGPGTGGKLGKATAAKTLGEQNIDAVLAALRFENGGRFTADYKYDYSNFKGSQYAFQLLGLRGARDPASTNPLGATAAFVLSLQPGLGGTNVQSFSPFSSVFEAERASDRLRVQGHSLTFNYELTDQLQLKNIAAFRKTAQLSYGNSFQGNHLIDPFGGTRGDFSFLNAISNRPQKQWSDEIQLTGNYDRFSFVAGGFYFKEKARDDTWVMFFKTYPLGGGPVVMTPADRFAAADVSNRSTALFAQATVHVTDDLDITGGVRHTWDKRYELTSVSTPVRTNKSFAKATWQAVAEYKVTPDTMLYAKVGTGYLSGGVYNGKPFNPENLTQYEVGVKGDFLDKTLRFNANGFYGQYKDMIVQIFTTVLNYENAAKANIKGLEFETTYVPVRGLTLSGNLGLQEFKYKRYLSGVFGAVDLSDVLRRANMPKVTASARVQYDFAPMSNGAYVSAAVDTVFRGRTNFPVRAFADPALDKAANSRAHWLVNARVSLLELPAWGSTARVALWTQNLFNKRYIQHSADISGIVAGSFNRPRTYGVDLSVNF